MVTTEVRTRRLVIRTYVTEDYEAWKEGFSSRRKPARKHDLPPVAERDLPRSLFLRKLKRYAVRAEKDDLYVFCLFLRTTGAHIGTIDLRTITRHDLQSYSVTHTTTEFVIDRKKYVLNALLPEEAFYAIAMTNQLLDYLGKSGGGIGRLELRPKWWKANGRK